MPETKATEEEARLSLAGRNAQRGRLEKAMSVFADTRAGEGPSAALLTLSVFLLLTSYYLLKTAREPLILEGGAELKSYSSAGQALLLVPMTWLYGQLARRVGRIKLITYVTLFFASNLVVFFGLHALHVKIGVPFFLWVGVFNVTIVAQFWSFAADVYTDKQGKRLFAILGIGSTVGAVTGSELAASLIHPIGVYGLMLTAAVVLLASLAITREVHRREAKAPHAKEGGAQEGARDVDAPLAGEGGLALLLSDRYLFLIASLLFFLNCGNTNGEYILDRTLVQHLKDTLPPGVDAHAWTEEQIGIFKAHYFLYVNTATVLLQLFAVSRVIKYLGVRVGLFVAPLISLGGWATAFFFPYLGLIFAVKICENTLDYSLQNTAKQSLWLLTSRDEKYKAKNVVDSFIVRAGDFLSAGITLVGTALGFATRHFILVNAGLVGMWLMLVVLLARVHKTRERGRADVTAAPPPPPPKPPSATGKGPAGVVLALFLLSCASTSAPPRRFPLRDALLADTDRTAVRAPCREAPSKKDPHHTECTPATYFSPLVWDAVDNSIFRPMSTSFTISDVHRATNVNALDEVPDSAWFENRLGVHAMTAAEVAHGACTDKQVLDGQTAEDGTWVIDQGKSNGSSPGFRVNIAGKGKYMLKADGLPPERSSAGSVIGAAVYNAVGFNTSCEQIVFVKRSALKLLPGLTAMDNTGREIAFDEAALEHVVAQAGMRGEYLRFQASAWLPGHLVGPFRYEGTRKDDANDVVPHEHRRDLRGSRLVAAWLEHHDAREQNSMDTWIAADASGAPDASPGYVRHYMLDMSDCLGALWDWDSISRRMGHAYLVDWKYVGLDFVTLGIPERPWDRAAKTPGLEQFGYYTEKDFTPERWKNEYTNTAFDEMTEADGAWMARILARFTPEMIDAMARTGRFYDDKATAFLAATMKARLRLVLERYLTRLSPLADFAVDGDARLCGKDLARVSGLRGAAELHYSARQRTERGEERELPVLAGDDGGVCVALPHVAEDAGAPDAEGRYVVVRLTDSAAPGPLDVHLYDLGPRLGYRIAGLAR